jgi:hypothetical protein
MCGFRTDRCACEQGWRETTGQLRVPQDQWREAARPGNGAVCLTLNTRRSMAKAALGIGPSCDAAVDLTARPQKLPTDGANGAAADSESD